MNAEELQSLISSLREEYSSLYARLNAAKLQLHTGIAVSQRLVDDLNSAIKENFERRYHAAKLLDEAEEKEI